VQWRCQCECGNTTAAIANNIKGGKTDACDWLERQARSEFENYVDGYLNFALEFVCAHHGGAEFRLGKIVAKVPRAEAGVEEKRNVVKAVWKIGDKLSDHCGQTSCVITYRYKQPVLVENVKFVDEIKHLVAARFSIGLKPLQRVAEFCPNMLGHSLFNSTRKLPNTGGIISPMMLNPNGQRGRGGP
jgi:hypothetical protein